MFLARSYADVFDICGLEREIRRRAGNTGVTVRWMENDSGVCAISGRTLLLPRLPYPCHMDDVRLLRMQYIHELGHYTNPDALRLRNKYPISLDHPLGGMWNMVQDEYDERRMAMLYPGDRRALGEGHVVFVGRSLKRIAEFFEESSRELPPRPPGSDSVKKLSAHITCKYARSDWDPFNAPLMTAMLRTVDDETRALVATLMSEGWPDKVRGVQSSVEALDLAKLLYERLWPDKSADEELKQPDSKGKGEGESGGESGDAPPTQQGDEETQEEEKDTQGSAPRTQRAEIHWSDLVHSEHDGEKHEDSPSRIDYTGRVFTDDPWQPYSGDKVIITSSDELDKER